MINVQINLDQVKPERIEKNGKGQNIVKATLSKLVRPTESGATHILYHRVLSNDLKGRYHKKEVIGAGIDYEESVAAGSPEHFFMVFLEGGECPTAPHTSKDAALAEAVRLSTQTGKKAWVLETVASVNKEEPGELTEKEQQVDLPTVPVTKTGRKKIGKRPERATFNIK